MILLDDHLVRDLAASELSVTLDAPDDELATTNLWLFRLAGAVTRESRGALTGHIDEFARFRRELSERLEWLTVVPLEQLVWSMAEPREHHRAAGRPLSTAMVEALASAHHLGAEIAVARIDVGPGLRDSAEADGIAFRIVEP